MNRRLGALMSQKFLARQDVVSSFNQVGGKTVTKSVAAYQEISIRGRRHNEFQHRNVVRTTSAESFVLSIHAAKVVD